MRYEHKLIKGKYHTVEKIDKTIQSWFAKKANKIGEILSRPIEKGKRKKSITDTIKSKELQNLYILKII